MESSEALRFGAGHGPIAGPSTSLQLALSMPQAHGVTTHQGDVNLAGRDVHVHKHYHSYSDRVDISAILDTVRNLRKVHLDVLAKVTPGTGVWLLETDKFLIWVDPNGNLKILWGTGIPGAGKTVLASIVIRDLEARAEAAGGPICVCYVYIRYSDRADLTVRNILEILVKQTVERHPECGLLAEQAYARHLREKTQPTEAELLQLLHRFKEAFTMTFYLLDALDEAPDKIQVDLVQKIASLNVRLFITSRPLKPVEARVPDVHRFHIVAQEGDLDLHIAQEIGRSRDLADLLERVGPSLRDEIISLVKSKCGGMFLHASLQLDALCECATAREVRQTLEVFPSRIEDVYLQTWHRILEQRPTHVLLAKAALVWVLNASRSMTIEELERAVAISPDTYKFEPDRLAPGTTLVAFCRGLVTFEEESRLVRLVHYTAKDTLQELLHNSFPYPHAHLAAVCMTHLTGCGFQNTSMGTQEEFNSALEADPLLAYAASAWAVHARSSLDVEDTRRRTTDFVSKSSAYPAVINPYGRESFDVLHPLHMLAIYNLLISLITHDDFGDPNVTTKVHQDSPLTLASCLGHKDAVELLLARSEIQVNLADKHGQSALMLAARSGHEAITALLLEQPKIKVNVLDNGGRSVLMHAAGNGYEGVVTLLLAHPEIQVNLVNNKGWSALMFVAKSGHEGVVTVLLAHPDVQVNLVDEDGWPALIFAASEGHKGVVEMLLARPEILVNLVSGNGLSALMHAASEGNTSVVETLLARSEIRVNLVDNEGWSALMRAAAGGHEDIVTLLLACPEIQVNLVDNKEWSALMLAARYGHEGIVTLLLARSEIQVNMVDNEGWSALMMAARLGHEGVITSLLSLPVIQLDLVTAEEKLSALMLAARNGHQGVVKLLLIHPEIRVNSLDNEGCSALIEAAYYGHEGVVQLLLAHPEVQVNLSDDEGWQALSYAAGEGKDGVVKLLLAQPNIQVNLVDDEGYSALMKAAGWGHDAVVRLLLNVPHINTATKSTDGRQLTAMSLALERGHLGIVQLLQEFDLHRARLSSMASVENPAHQELTLQEPIDEDMSDDVGDQNANNEGREGVDDEGSKNIRRQDGPSGSSRGAKRSRGSEKDGLESPVDDTTLPAWKRRCGAETTEGA